MRNSIVILFFSMMFSLTVKAQQVTWSEDIACIVYSHCSNCHNNTNSLAAFPLMNYNQAWNQRLALKYFTGNKIMPPYLPNTDKVTYSHQKNLSEQEIALIKAWVDENDCLRGDSTTEPVPPVFANPISNLVSPDLTLRIPTYSIPPIWKNFSQCFVVSSPLSSTKLISAIEVLPGNLSAVYDVMVYSDTSSKCTVLDAADTALGYTNFGGIGSSSAKLLYGWVNGENSYYTPAGMVIPVDSNARIIIQVNYAEDAGTKVDSTKVNIKFSTDTSLRKIQIQPLLNYYQNLLNGPLYITADSVKTFYEQYAVSEDITVLSISPQAHHVCTMMSVFGVTPSNDTISFLEIDDWGAIWVQGAYIFQKPLKIPKGTLIHAKAFYDNTLSNGNNPNDPPEDITEGYGSNNERLLFYFNYLPYQNGDENLILDTIVHKKHYQNCSPVHTVTTGVKETEKNTSNFLVYPNPATSSITVQSLNVERNTEITVFNILGEPVLSRMMSASSESVDISVFSEGIYFLQLKSSFQFATFKIIKQ